MSPQLVHEMSIIRVNGVDFHVEDHGSGAPLVLLHGFTGSAASWSPVIHELARFRRVIAIDVIGHGASAAPADPSHYAFEQALRDLAAVIAQLGIARAAWLGYSMGGRLALGMAVDHPQRVSSLILESATPGIQHENERLQRAEADQELATHIEEVGIELFVDEWEQLPIWESQRVLPAEVLQFQREIRLRNRAVGLASSLRGMGQGAQPSYWDRLGEIEVPVLLMAGALDRKFVGIAGQMGIRIAGAELSVVPDAGHAVHLERPHEFLEEVRAFLARCDPLRTSQSQENVTWR
ncbi:MAG TPA: 2-succinyl-6-hydroxy-2,4-cyclohexadiene-1-carboxylate synthase [Thermomicrobiales bacterium]|nr:2-succinyl-6-hydroxy-2,4-cyclohexadiene-1-carboxylate synthase [Thermomicrobiales bacterium]